LKTRLFASVRWKIVLLFLVSALLSLVTVVILYYIAFQYRNSNPVIRGTIRYLYYHVGPTTTGFLAGFILFISFVLLFSRRSIRYLVEITRSLQHVAAGEFDKRIPVRTSDELGDLAENINRMAEQLKASIEEERMAERTKNELITSVSHDLRTPLTSITGYLELIGQDRYRDEVELRYYIDIVRDKSQRLKLLVDDLFEYTRASGGGMHIRKSTINLHELLGQLAAQYGYQLQKAGLAVRFDFAAEKMMVSADGDKLVRVFENLLANAMTYGSMGKTIVIRVRREGAMVVTEMINYGEPIPLADLPHIFERFYRVEKSRAEHLGGSGLGLAISKHIVTLHGGTIAADSGMERTVFTVALPANETV
jgi:signal transduction histidine kinase